ncbi:MAG: CFI-box-CTERM domain-containing protein [bacterium]|nr:CFI-box-CTERM domain-containing protein [bacterium]
MLAACYECGEKISTEARRCPKCGFDYAYDTSGMIDDEIVVCKAVYKTESGPRRWPPDQHWNRVAFPHVIKRLKEQAEEKKKEESGCFIATAAYGTPMANEVGLLRRFRDENLAYCRIGRMFIATYYRLSPPVAEIIKRNKVLRFITRTVLRPIIWLIRK